MNLNEIFTLIKNTLRLLNLEQIFEVFLTMTFKFSYALCLGDRLMSASGPKSKSSTIPELVKYQEHFYQNVIYQLKNRKAKLESSAVLKDLYQRQIAVVEIFRRLHQKFAQTLQEISARLTTNNQPIAGTYLFNDTFEGMDLREFLYKTDGALIDGTTPDKILHLNSEVLSHMIGQFNESYKSVLAAKAPHEILDSIVSSYSGNNLNEYIRVLADEVRRINNQRDALIQRLNSLPSGELAKTTWDTFKNFSLSERQSFKGATRLRIAVVFKEYMLARARDRKPMHPVEYYDAILEKLASNPILDSRVRVKEGVTQNEHMQNIIKAAQYLDNNFEKVMTKVLDEYIDCASKGVSKVMTANPDSIIYSGLQGLSLDEKRLLRAMNRGMPHNQEKGNISIYGHKYDPFSPTFGDDLFLALDTIIVNITCSYDYAKENSIERDWFTSPWWLACLDGAASNIAGVWMLIEAPQKGKNLESLLIEFARGTVPLHALPPTDFKDMNEFTALVVEPYIALSEDSNKSRETFLKRFKGAPFAIEGEAIFERDGQCSPLVASILESLLPSSAASSSYRK